jgi:hypothetical protein
MVSVLVEKAVAGGMAEVVAPLQMIVVGRMTLVRVGRRPLRPRRWRDGAERRVALGHTASVRPWPPIVELEVTPTIDHAAMTVQRASAPLRTYIKGLAGSPGLVAGLSVELLKEHLSVYVLYV